jgi:hypothetical protein
MLVRLAQIQVPALEVELASELEKRSPVRSHDVLRAEEAFSRGAVAKEFAAGRLAEIANSHDDDEHFEMPLSWPQRGWNISNLTAGTPCGSGAWETKDSQRYSFLCSAKSRWDLPCG